MSKIVFFVGEFPVLSETFVINQVAAFVESKFDVKIISLFPQSTGEKHPPIGKYRLIDKRTTIYSDARRMTRIGNVISAVFCDLLSLKPKRLAWLLRAGFDGYMIGRAFEKIDGVVVCHFGARGAILANLKNMGIVSNIDIVTIFHGFDMSVRSLLEQYRDSYKTLFKEGRLMLPVSNFWRKKLVSMGCNPNSILTQHMGVNLDEFACRKRYAGSQYGGRRINLICVCRFVEKKGVPILLRALSNLPSNYRLDLVGSGEQQKRIEELVIALNLTNRVDIAGPLSSDQVADRLNKADAFVLPSITAENGDMEGVPVALMEAMAQGLLVFSTYHSGIPELIQHGKTGFLSEEYDYLELARHIEYAFETLSSTQRQTIAANALQKVSREFNLNTLDQELIRLVSSIQETA